MKQIVHQIAHGTVPSMYTTGGLRSPDVKQAYLSYLEQLQHDNIKPETPILEKLGTSLCALLKNEFPYNRLFNEINKEFASKGQEVRHCCLWNRNGKMTPEEIRQAIQDLNIPGLIDYCWFENDFSHKSIHDLWHVQVFILVDLNEENNAKLRTSEVRKS